MQHTAITPGGVFSKVLFFVDEGNTFVSILDQLTGDGQTDNATTDDQDVGIKPRHGCPPDMS